MKKPTILIVDDNPSNLEVLIEYLSQLNYEVLVAESGMSAIERVSYLPPDLILLDVMMPGMDGFETCRRFKADPRTAPIPLIFMTILDETFNMVRGFEVGAVDYITKPIKTAELAARIHTHLTLRDLQKNLEAQVNARTQALQTEIERHKIYEMERERLHNIIMKQSDQLQTVTQWLMKSQEETQQGITYTLHKHVSENLMLLKANLETVQTLITHSNLIDRNIHTRVTLHLDRMAEVLSQLENYVTDMTINLKKQHQQTQDLGSNPLLLLSAREREVLELVINGKSNTDISQLLNLTMSSIGTYRNRIRQKLGVDDIPSLVKLVMQHGLPK